MVAEKILSNVSVMFYRLDAGLLLLLPCIPASGISQFDVNKNCYVTTRATLY